MCIGGWAVPQDTAPSQKEVAATTQFTPHRGMKRDGAAEVAYGPPTRLVVGEQAELDGSFAPARAEKCGRPRTGVIADEIKAVGHEDIGQIFNRASGESRA